MPKLPILIIASAAPLKVAFAGLASLLAVVLASAAAAQPKPAPEMERLIQLLDGRWITAVTYEKSPATPKGGVGSGEEVSRPGPGGSSLVIETSSVGPGGRFEAIGLITWSAPERAYRLHWLTSASPTVAVLTGRWKGPDLVFDGAEILGGQEMASRHSIVDPSPNAFGYTIDMGPTPARLTRVLTIRYTRD